MHLARSVPSIGWFGVCGLLVRACLGEVAGDWSSYAEWIMSALVFTGVIKTSWGACVSTMFISKKRDASSFLGSWWPKLVLVASVGITRASNGWVDRLQLM
jgi:hypothetical protein